MHDTLYSLIERALNGNPRPLEFYLRNNSRLPGPRANLELANDLSHLLASSVPRYPDNVHKLLDYLTTNEHKIIASNTPGEFLLLCGIIAAGACAAIKPEWRNETRRMLSHFAGSPYWRVRESVALAFQHLLTADQQETIAHLTHLASDGIYLQQRAVLAAVSEPPILCAPEMVKAALAFHRTILNRFHAVPLTERKNEEFRILKRALGYTLSVVTAAAPDEGFALMRECAAWNDQDIAWILRENLKKKRLAKFAQDAAGVAKLLA